jgi:hypothetical protein
VGISAQPGGLASPGRLGGPVKLESEGLLATEGEYRLVMRCFLASCPRDGRRKRRGEKSDGPLRVRAWRVRRFLHQGVKGRRKVAVWKAAAGPRHAVGMSAMPGGVASPGRLGGPVERESEGLLATEGEYKSVMRCF